MVSTLYMSVGMPLLAFVFYCRLVPIKQHDITVHGSVFWMRRPGIRLHKR